MRLYTMPFMLAALLLSGCNLAFNPPPPTTLPTFTAESESVNTLEPSRTPFGTTAQPPTLLPPPLPTSNLPTAIPLGTAGTPTVNAALADQRYELQVRPNHTIGVNYTITMTRGTVTLVLQGTDGLVWQQTFTTAETGRAEVPIKQGGMYEVLATIENFDGNFNISWDQKPT
ncbi:MAG: hypothetical protein K8L97_32390 [Anaerolineae bacterium]|nr:hypothetical protein [Anaerolineae bacterium]